MLFILLPLFFHVVASADGPTPGCAAAPRRLSLLQVQAERSVRSGLTEQSSAHEAAQGHRVALAVWQKAHAAAIKKRSALQAFENSLLDQRNAPEDHPNSSVEYHANASASYQREKCQVCASAEEAYIATLQAAQSAHFRAQAEAVTWAEARDAYDDASQAFTDALAAHAATKNKLVSTTITYESSEEEYTSYANLAEHWYSEAQLASHAEAWKVGNKSTLDAAKSEYDTAAATAKAKDDLAVTKRAEEQSECAEFQGPKNSREVTLPEPTGGAWVLVLQYGDAAYEPTTEASGTISDETEGFAKLSDDDINAIDDGDATYDYFMLTSKPQTGSDSGKAFVRVPNQSFKDTASNMGWGTGENIRFCAKQSAVNFGDCTSWTGNGCSRFDTQCVSGYAYDCNRWFMDYPGSVQCYKPRVDGKRCLSGNGGCDSPAGASGIRIDFKLWKLEV